MNKVLILVLGVALIYVAASGRLQDVWLALTQVKAPAAND